MKAATDDDSPRQGGARHLPQPENGYCVLRLEARGKTLPGARNREGRVTVVGVMPALNPGEEVAF